MKRFSFVMFAFAAVFGTGLAAHAADSPVEAIPSQAGVVIRFATPDTSVKQGVALANKIDPSVGGTLEIFAAGVGQVIDNPAKAGIVKDSDWWVAVFPKQRAEPGIVYAVDTADLAALKDAVGESYQYLTYENWTLYTEDSAAADAIKSRIGGDGKSIESASDDKIRSIFGAANISVFVNLTELKTMYADELEQARGELKRAMDEASAFAPPQQGVDINAVFDMYGKMFDSMFAALQDSESFTVGTHFQEDGLRFEEYLRVTPDSNTAKFLKKHKMSALTALQKLPSGQLGYFGLHGDFASITSWSMELVSAMFQLDDEAKQEMKAVSEEAAKLKYGDYVASFGLGDRETGFLQATVVSEIENASELRGFYEKSLKMMSKLGGGSFPGLSSIEFERDVEKVGERSVDKVTVKQEIDEQIDPLGIQKQVMEAMYGPEGAVTRIVYTDRFVVQTTGGGLAAMEQALKGLEGTSTDAIVAATRKQLAKEANLLVLFDVPGFFGGILRAVAESGAFPIPVTPEMIDDLDLQPSYMGFSVGSSAGGLHIDSYVPAAQMQGIFKLVQTGIAAFQSMQNPQF